MIKRSKESQDDEGRKKVWGSNINFCILCWKRSGSKAAFVTFCWVCCYARVKFDFAFVIFRNLFQYIEQKTLLVDHNMGGHNLMGGNYNRERVVQTSQKQQSSWMPRGIKWSTRSYWRLMIKIWVAFHYWIWNPTNRKMKKLKHLSSSHFTEMMMMMVTVLMLPRKTTTKCPSQP